MFNLLVSSAVFASKNESCIQVNKVLVHNVSEDMRRDVRKKIRTYSSKCLKGGDIQKLFRELTNLYVKSGYITSRINLPEQDLSSGVLSFNVVEGVIEEIDVDNEWKLLPLNLPFAKGDKLSLRDIEQAHDQYNKLSTNDVKITLEPGRDAGGTKIVIKNKPSKRYSFSTGVDNSSSKSKGRLQNYNNIKLESIMGLNEVILFGYRSSLEDRRDRYTENYNGAISVPFGYNEIGFSYNHADYRNFIHSIGNSYENRGGSWVHKLDLSRVIYRDNASKSMVSFGVGYDDYKNYLADNRIDVSTYKIEKYNLGISHQHRLESSVVSGDLSFTYGVNRGFYSNFGDARVPHKYFYKINFTGSWLKPLPIRIADLGMNYNLLLSAQYSPHLLTTSEKGTLGGNGSVRGFDEYIENAENIAFARNELALEIEQNTSKTVKRLFGQFSVFTAFDIGFFENREDSGSRAGFMSGVAVGMKNNSDGVVDVSFTISRPLQTTQFYKHENIISFSVGIHV